MMRLKAIGMAAAVCAGLGLVTAAQAAPLAPALAVQGDAQIERVRDGCGPGGHANIYGECRSNYPTRPRYYGGYGAYGGYPAYGYGYAPRPQPYYGGYGYYGGRGYY